MKMYFKNKNKNLLKKYISKITMNTYFTNKNKNEYKKDVF